MTNSQSRWKSQMYTYLSSLTKRLKSTFQTAWDRNLVFLQMSIIVVNPGVPRHAFSLHFSFQFWKNFSALIVVVKLIKYMIIIFGKRVVTSGPIFRISFPMRWDIFIACGRRDEIYPLDVEEAPSILLSFLYAVSHDLQKVFLCDQSVSD